MTPLLCPRCREPNTGPPLPSGWLSCRRCNHRWLPVNEASAVSATAAASAAQAAVDQPAPTDVSLPALPVVPATSPPVARVSPAPQAPAAPTPLPPPVPPVAMPPAPPASSSPVEPAAQAVAVAQAPAVATADAADSPIARTRQDTNEYPPDETSELRQRTKALTSRRDAPLPGVVAPAIAARVAAGNHAVSPKPPPTAQAAPAAKGASAGPAVGDPFDADLFDRMERDAQQQRARQHTVAEPPAATPVDAVIARQITCPVCGHGFLSTKVESEHQVCPQCHTSFNIAKGHVVSGGPRLANDDPLIGRALRGCLIDRKIGEGGMGSVYHARQLSLDRSVAVKVLPPELARNRNFISRFEREAKSLAKINHPNILHIYDFGEEPQLSVYFMIIEFVEGKDLGEILHEQYSMGQVEVLDIVRQAALGLEMAAEKGVIHRDIKPDNLMLTAEGICKVSDFGLAKGHGAERDVTNVGVRVGTPAFMSPEQCDGVDVDFRSDIYNLGCTAFLALTGSLPYDADTPFAIMLKHKNDPVPSLLTFNPNLHPRVDSLVQRMIAKAPADRFGSLRELVELVEELEVEIAGTTNVLRKSRGPFRAMTELEAVEHARMTSKGLRDDSGSAPLPPPRSVPAALPAARGSLAPAPLPTTVPDWLKPVEQPPVKRPSSSVGPTVPNPTPPPATASSGGSGFRDLRVKLAEARNRNLQEEAVTMAASADRLAAAGQHEEAAAAWQRAASLSPNMRDSQELQARATRAKLYGGRRRTIRIVTILAVLVMLAAVSTWQGTPVLHNYVAERELEPIVGIINPGVRLHELDRFVAAYGQPYTWYTTLFLQPYQIEAAITARRASDSLRRQLIPPISPPTSAVAPPTPLAPRQAQGAPVPHDATAVAVAAVGASTTSAPVPAAPPAATPVDPRLVMLEKDFKDPAVTWQAFAKQASALGPLSGPSAERAHEMIVEAQHQLQLIEQDIKAIRASWASGQQAQALDLIAQFRLAHARSGDTLPTVLPARIEVLDSDSNRKISDVHIITRSATPLPAGGLISSPAQLAAGERRFGRFATIDLTVEIASPGYRTESIHVPANPDEQEQRFQVVLHPAVRWQRQIGSGLSWIRFRSIDERTIMARHDDGITTLRMGDGTVLANIGRTQLPATPQSDSAPAHWTGVWTPTPQGVIVGTSDGLAVLMANPAPNGFAVIETLYRGRGPILAVSEHELTFQAGRRAIFVVEGLSNSTQLIARTSERDLWTVPGLLGHIEPQVWFHDDRVLVLDDARAQAIDETDGHLVSSVPLDGKRTGPGALLDQGGVIAIPITTGIELLRMSGQGGERVEVFRDSALDQADGRMMSVADGQILVARADRSIRLLAWKDGHADPMWSQSLPSDSQAIAFLGLNGDHVLVVDEAGSIFLYARSTGALQRRFASAAPLLGPPFEVQGMLIAGDRTGTVTAMMLPPLP